MLEDMNKKIGLILKEKRKKNGYSLENINMILKDKYKISLDDSNISRYENGTVKNMNPKFLRALCEINKIDYIPLFKELEFLDKEVKDERLLNLKNTEKREYNDLIEGATMFFNDVKISVEDKKKLVDSLTELFFDSKIKNKK